MATALARARRLILPEIIGRGHRAHPDRPALVFAGEQRTHAQVHERAARLATVLADGGVGHGDRVALLLHNGFEFVESMLACHVLGAVAVPVNFRLAAEEVSYILEDSGAVALIAGVDPGEVPETPLRLDVGPAYEQAVAAAASHPDPAAL